MVEETQTEQWCKTCVLMKGAHKYCHTKCMKEKMQARREARQQRRAEHCTGKGPKRVHFATDILYTSFRLHTDDMLWAYQARVDLHIDFAHTIALGYHQQRYYLAMVVDGKDFLWASPTKTQEDPEALLEEFIPVTRVKIGKLCMDNASVFAKSASFLQWCESRSINMCPTPGYNHTMQALAESAVHICKEHVHCLLKYAGMPYRFWLWALTQFCRVYNWWPSKGHAQLWELLQDTDICHDIKRDLQTFWCYTIGLLPREHPEVQDTTNSDRGLEGAFLGWDIPTPTCWIYSFRLQRPI